MQMNKPQLSATQHQTTGWFFSCGMLLITLWVLTFWPTLVSMENVWRGSETYMHCYFIPVISAWLIWPYRKAINQTALGSQRGLWCLIPSLLVWFIGFAADINLIAHFGAMFCLISLLWCWLGDDNFKLLRFPLLYLLFAVPFGDEVNAPLQFITAEMAVWLLQLTGIPVLHEGLYITTPVGAFEVAEACSGVRFMIVALALAFLFSHLHFRTWKKRAVFIVALLLMSIIANSFRAYFLIFIGEKTNMAYGFGADHYYYGWAFFAIVIFIAFHVGGKFADNEEIINESANVQATKHPVAIILSVTLLGILNLALNTIWQPESPPSQARQLTVPSNWNWSESNRVKPNFQDALALGSFKNQNDLEYFVVQYANRQTTGELIGWNNQLYSADLWRVANREELKIGARSWQEITLSGLSGRKIFVYFSYQIGDVFTTDKSQAKLQQAIDFILYKKTKAILHHLNCQDDKATCRTLVEGAGHDFLPLE